jgi:hypothetical protein
MKRLLLVSCAIGAVAVVFNQEPVSLKIQLVTGETLEVSGPTSACFGVLALESEPVDPRL